MQGCNREPPRELDVVSNTGEGCVIIKEVWVRKIASGKDEMTNAFNVKGDVCMEEQSPPHKVLDKCSGIESSA